MKKDDKTQTTSNLILKTAGKTAAVLCVLLVLFCAFFVLLAPKSSSDFFYSLGMKKSAAALAYTQAERSNDFEDWWGSLIKSIDAQSWDKAYFSAERLQQHEEYSQKISEKTIKVGRVSYDAKYYVRYNYVKCGVLAFKNDENRRAQFLEYAIKDLTNVNGWGTYISNAGDYGYNVYTPNPIKGYVDALCTDTSIPLDNTMSVLYEMYNTSGRFANIDTSWYSATNWYPSKKKDLACHVVKLCRARPDDQTINSTDRYYWHSAASIPMPEN